jgi:peptide methionine sulfoxide reductase MsrB
MKLFDDIDTFEIKTTKVLTQGLSPVCDHGGFDEGQFCCMGCSTPVFDKDDLSLESGAIYSFRRPINFSLFDYSFDSESFYPRTEVSCINCHLCLGFIQFNTIRSEKIFCIYARSVFLQLRIKS